MFPTQDEIAAWLRRHPAFLDRVVAAWIKSMTPIVKADIQVSWTTPKIEMDDPKKDGDFEQVEIASGLKSWSKAVRTRGEDPDAVFAELMADVERFRAAGIPYPGQVPAPTPAEAQPEDDAPDEEADKADEEIEDDKKDE